MTDRMIPDVIVGRLPHYLRTLEHLSQEGVLTTSSQEMGTRLNISPAQIRKDLSQFGEFGKQGTGYSVNFLVEKLQEILKVNRNWEIALVGAGDLGHAAANYQGFRECGFHLVMVFDNDPRKIGSKIADLIVEDIVDLERRVAGAGIQIAMIATPAIAAQQVAEQLIRAGIKAILNYAPITLVVPEEVRVQYIDPVIHLQRMTYYLEK